MFARKLANAWGCDQVQGKVRAVCNQALLSSRAEEAEQQCNSICQQGGKGCGNTGMVALFKICPGSRAETKPLSNSLSPTGRVCLSLHTCVDAVKARSMDAAQLSNSLSIRILADAEGEAAKPLGMGMKSANVASELAIAMASALFWAAVKSQLCPPHTINGRQARSKPIVARPIVNARCSLCVISCSVRL